MIRSKTAWLAAAAVCASLLSGAPARADGPLPAVKLDAAPIAGAASSTGSSGSHVNSCVSSCCQIFVPNMIGDGLGVPLTGFAFDQFAVIPYPAHIAKIGENHQVLPQDRMSFSYGYYNSFPTVVGSAGLDRDVDLHDFKFLFEKTLRGGRASVELIVPFAYTLDSNQSRNAAEYGVRGTELGNIAFGGKVLLVERENSAVCAGLLVEVPTADDLVVASGAGIEELRNDPWFFTPYLGARWTPNDRLFSQAFVSYRMPTSDYRAFANGVAVGADYDVQDLLLLDWSAGYWIYRDPHCNRIRGVAPMIELHYATTTTDAREAFNANTINRVDSLNLTLGATALVGERGTVALGFNIPLNDGDLAGFGPTNRSYDWNLALQFNLFFGGRR